MYGPSVRKSFADKLKTTWKANNATSFIDIGSFPPHYANNTEGLKLLKDCVNLDQIALDLHLFLDFRHLDGKTIKEYLLYPKLVFILF